MSTTCDIPTAKSQPNNIQVSALLAALPDELGIRFGQKEAKHRIVAFLNAACSGSKKWLDANYEMIAKAATNQQVILQILLWNKPNLELVNGNIAQHYLRINDPRTLIILRDLYAHQDAFKAIREEASVIGYVEKKYHAHHENNQYTIDRIDKLASENGVRVAPTLIVDEKAYVGSASINDTDLASLLA